MMTPVAVATVVEVQSVIAFTPAHAADVEVNNYDDNHRLSATVGTGIAAHTVVRFSGKVLGEPWAIVVDNNQNIAKFGQIVALRNNPDEPEEVKVLVMASGEGMLQIKVYAFVQQ